jgi:hypothetical protein
MGWADEPVRRLAAGETVSFRPVGRSMEPRIRSGQCCTVEPIPVSDEIPVGTIVLCTVKGSQYLHLVKDYGPMGYLIGNNHGRINGRITRAHIHGRLVRVEP